MAKKMLVIMASPRKQGNISKMVEIAVESGRTAGYDVDFINLYDGNIAYCKGCMGCKKTGVCVIQDDIQGIREKLIACDVLVLASPTYFANVTAPMKNMLDRLVGAVMDDNNSSIPKPKLSSKQKYLLMTTCNTPAPFDKLAGQSTGCLKAMEEVCHISGMKCLGKVTFAGTRGKTEIPNKVKQKIESYLKYV